MTYLNTPFYNEYMYGDTGYSFLGVEDVMTTDPIAQAMSTPTPTPTPEVSGSNTPWAALGISVLSNYLSTQQGLETFRSQLKAKTDAVISNMEIASTNYEYEMVKSRERIDDLDNALGDKLSARSLQTLKTQARLRAAAAETGTRGGTTDLAIKEAYIAEHFDKANIIAQAKSQRSALTQAMEAKKIKLIGDIKSMTTGVVPEINTSSILAGLTGGLQTFNSMYSMLTPRQQEELFF